MVRQTEKSHEIDLPFLRHITPDAFQAAIRLTEEMTAEHTTGSRNHPYDSDARQKKATQNKKRNKISLKDPVGLSRIKTFISYL